METTEQTNTTTETQPQAAEQVTQQEPVVAQNDF